MGPPTPCSAPALPGPLASPLCCVGTAGRHWHALVAPVAPRAPRLLLCPPLSLASVLAASPPAHPSPSRRALSLCFLPPSAFSCRLSFLSQPFTRSSFSLFHSFLIGQPSGHTACWPRASPQDLPCPRRAAAFPHGHALAFWARLGSDSTQRPGPGSCTCLPAPLAPKLSPIAGFPPASSTPVWAEPWPPTCTELL